MPKLLVIVGITGNQGGSIAARFLQDANYRIRGLTRNPASPSAQALSAQGIEIIQADLNDRQSLISAFSGANLIFSVTNYWEPFFRADGRARAAEAGISCRRYAYEVEVQQGKNIADATAQTVESLDENGFIASTLSHAGRCSGGNFQELYHFDAKAEVFPGYVRERYPRLAQKMSCVQTGYFMSSYKLLPEAFFRKMPDGSFQMSLPTVSDAPAPQLEVNADTGNFVYAVSKLPPGKSYMAEGTTCTWTEYIRLWSEVTKVPASYKQITLDELIENTPDKEFGREVGDMFAYTSDPGYDGGDPTLWRAVDIRKAGIECPMTSLEDWMKKEDWSAVLGK